MLQSNQKLKTHSYPLCIAVLHSTKMFPEKVCIFFKIDYHASFQYTEVCGASVAVDSASLYIPSFIITDGRRLKKWSV